MGSSASSHSRHDEAWLLLPWYVNGSLEGPEFALVQQHLKGCITCRKELAIQQRTARALHDSSVVTHSSQIAFSRLRRRIATESQPRRRWRVLWSHAVAGLLTASVRRRAAIAFSLVLAIGIALPMRHWLMPVNDEPEYHTLADPAGLPAALKNQIYVVFADRVGPDQIAWLLRAVDAKIVDGPNSLSVYTLRITADDRSDRDLVAVIRRLHRNPRVQFAEPALPTADGNAGSNDQ